MAEYEDSKLTFSHRHLDNSHISAFNAENDPKTGRRTSMVNCREEDTLQRVGGAEMQAGTKLLVRLTTNGWDIISTEKGEKQTPH